MIISSPYRRARETALSMMKTVIAHSKKDNIQTNTPKKILIDVDISEYLGNHKHVDLDVTDKTAIYNPPHPEKYISLNTRIDKHYNKMTKYSKTHPSENIWVITHGIVIRRVSYLLGMKMSKHFPSLTCLSITEYDDLTKREVLLFHDSEERRHSSSDSYENYNKKQYDSYSRTGNSLSTSNVKHEQTFLAIAKRPAPDLDQGVMNSF